MRLNEIVEGTEADKLRGILRRDCMPYLREIGPDNEIIAYRGMQDTDESDAYGKHKTRLDSRKPSGTSKVTHDRLNELFTKHFGKPYRNGLFVTGDEDQAESYANVYAIFPIGEFAYLWHPKIDDLYSFITGDSGFTDESTDVKIARVEAIVASYRTDGLDSGIRSGNEIMVWCEEYYYIRPEIIRRLHI